MSRRRKNNADPISLFSFQDIITGVSGIMIFILLTLSLQLLTEVDSEDTEHDPEETTETSFNIAKTFPYGPLVFFRSFSPYGTGEYANIFPKTRLYPLAPQEVLMPMLPNFQKDILPDEPLVLLPERQDVDSHSIVSKKELEGLFKNRTEKKRQLAVQKFGGTEKGQETLRNALDWLKSVQSPDGSWHDPHGTHGMTGLVLLAFLAHGETVRSERYGTTVSRAIDFLKQDVEKIHKDPYQNALRTFALAEAMAMNSIEGLEDTVKLYTSTILNGQQAKGAFHYKYDLDMKIQDLSVMAWNIQALKSVNAVVDMPGIAPALERASIWLKSMSTGEFQFPYHSHNNTPKEKRATHSMRAAGTLCLQLLERGDIPEIENELHEISTIDMNNLDWHNVMRHPLYGWYYANQCMFQAGGDKWLTWNARCEQMLIENQHPQGFWFHPRHKRGNLPIYSTALCALMLTVYYRYPPREEKEKAVEEEPEVIEIVTEIPEEIIPQKIEPEMHLVILKEKEEELKKRLKILRELALEKSDILKEINGINLDEINKEIEILLAQKEKLDLKLEKYAEENKEDIDLGEDMKAKYFALSERVKVLQELLDSQPAEDALKLQGKRADGKRPVFIEISDSKLKVKVGELERVDHYKNNDGGLKLLQSWLEERNNQLEYVVVLLKPSGIKTYRQLKNAVEEYKFSTALEPMEEKLSID